MNHPSRSSLLGDQSAPSLPSPTHQDGARPHDALPRSSAAVCISFSAPGVLQSTPAQPTAQDDRSAPQHGAGSSTADAHRPSSYIEAAQALRQQHITALLDAVPQEHRAALSVHLYAPDSELGEPLPSLEAITEDLESWKDLILDDVEQEEDSFIAVPCWAHGYNEAATYAHNTREQAANTCERVRGLLPSDYRLSLQCIAGAWQVYAGPPCCAAASTLLSEACGVPIDVPALPRVDVSLFAEYRALYHALGGETALDEDGALSPLGLKWLDRIVQSDDPGSMLRDCWPEIVREYGATLLDEESRNVKGSEDFANPEDEEGKG